MQQPLSTRAPVFTAPSFYLTGRQPLRLGAILLALLASLGGLCSIVYAMGHTGVARLSAGNFGSTSHGSDHDAEDKDDPNQIDTIVLGDPADAPVPGRKGDHVSSVHPTILVHLPRYGDKTGLIPDTPAGHLLYSWLAAFNRASSSALGNALPSIAPSLTAAAQMALRQQTGGFNLLSAKEVQPGILVFRLRDQTPIATEALGTLQVRPNSDPTAIASFSIRAVPSPSQDPAPPMAASTR